jgi:hypothetical protein
MLISGESSQNYAVLLHGLGRTAHSMNKMTASLAEAGYQTINIGYPSTGYKIEKLAWMVNGEIARKCVDTKKKIHFVTHSLGGIILRLMQQENTVPNIGRVVMLCPPNNGSELAEILKNNLLFKIATGPAGSQLGTGAQSLPKNLGAVNFELGIITGNRSFTPVSSRIFNGANDGKVAVESAKVKGMRDFMVVNCSHTFIMNSPEVISQTIHFLKNSMFEKQGIYQKGF